MARNGVTVVGAKRLRRTLKKAGLELDDLKAVHSAVAAKVAGYAAARAPRRSGRLASTVRGNRAAARSTVMAGRASVPYAGPIHWGWRARGIAANPWISEAAQESEPEWLNMFYEGIDRVLSTIEGA